MEPVVADYLPRFFTESVLRKHPAQTARVREIMLATDPLGAAAVLRGMAARVAAGDLFESMRIPVTVVAGRDDAVVPLDHQHAIAAAIDGAQVAVLDSGHLPQVEAGSALSAELRRLLDRVER